MKTVVYLLLAAGQGNTECIVVAVEHFFIAQHKRNLEAIQESRRTLGNKIVLMSAIDTISFNSLAI